MKGYYYDSYIIHDIYIVGLGAHLLTLRLEAQREMTR